MRKRPFYIVVIRNQHGFPDLDAYTHNESLAKCYAEQWDSLHPEIYLIYDDNIIELMDNPEYKKILGNHTMSKDNKMTVTYIQTNGFHVKDSEKAQFIFTDQQWIDISEGSEPVQESIQYILASVYNLIVMSKYIKDPLFGSIMKFIYNRYIKLMVLSDLAEEFDKLNMKELVKLDPRLPYNGTKSEYCNQLDFNDYIDIMYLDYLVVKNNN